MDRSWKLLSGPRLAVGGLCVCAVAILSCGQMAANEELVDLARYDRKIKAADRAHWSFQPVKKPAVPVVKNSAWVRNAIDAFVLAKLEGKGWKPSPAAEPRAWLRRVHLDVTGLPPTIAEQDAFLKSPTSEAMDAIARDLVRRPTHGERWARHWLDVVRYAESNGYERDAAKPSVWRYRDYVIRAFNEDKPIDRFIMEQLAGDELPNANAESLIALGFNRLGPWDDEPADPTEDRFDQLDDVISATSLSFLGLSVGCARCHDHKFEAITMHDYYRMVAIFNPLVRPRHGRTELDLPVGTKEEIQRFQRREEKIARLTRPIPKGQAPTKEVQDHVQQLRTETPDLPRGYFLHEMPGKIPDTHFLIRGKPGRASTKVEPGVPAVLVANQPTFLPSGPESSNRRLTLAKWITNANHPLTARVFVNRVWHYHFGEGLVRTPNDFGTMGQSPTHPELLDWLASWFVENGWSMRKLHELILTSNTYRMSKTWSAEYGTVDPENQVLWRFPSRRLEVETIRDAALAVSGKLNTKMFGPSMFPEIPKEALAGNSDPATTWKASDESETSRRSIYAFIKRALIVPMFEVMDLCDTTRPNDKRLTTTVAPQALTLFNGDFVNRQAKHFADRLRKEAGPEPDRQIHHAYRLALCRPPTSAEVALMQQFLTHESLEQMCRVILNLNEFVYSD